jgi:predicted metal-binding membrane protein
MERPHLFSFGLTGVAGVLFAASAGATVVWSRSMAPMDMTMPGGWTMSMAWMRMPGQTWPGAAASFAAMWAVMMLAMMLPSIAPALGRYADALARVSRHRAWALVMVAGAAYFSVWTAAGLAVFPAGAALTAIEMAHPAVARAVPAAGAVVLLIAGARQLTAAKARALACCGAPVADAHPLPADAAAAWRHGVRLGGQCLRCCGNLMIVLLVVGVMDLATMALVTLAMTAERVSPGGERIARVVGVAVIACGIVGLAHAFAAP